jgi:hypothetical protein
MPKRGQHRATEGQAGTDPRSGLVAQGASGEMAPAAPSLRHPRRRARPASPAVHSAANLARSAFTTGAGTNFNSASSSASGVICFKSDDEMWE